MLNMIPSVNTANQCSVMPVLSEISWDNDYFTGNHHLDDAFGSVFACYDDFRICVCIAEYNSHITRSLTCLAEAFDSAFLTEQRLLACSEYQSSNHHIKLHDDILNKLWLAITLSRHGVVNEIEIATIFTDWVLIHLAGLDRIYVGTADFESEI